MNPIVGNTDAMALQNFCLLLLTAFTNFVIPICTNILCQMTLMFSLHMSEASIDCGPENQVQHS
jgi:hypothetical protein